MTTSASKDMKKMESCIGLVKREVSIAIIELTCDSENSLLGTNSEEVILVFQSCRHDRVHRSITYMAWTSVQWESPIENK